LISRESRKGGAEAMRLANVIRMLAMVLAAAACGAAGADGGAAGAWLGLAGGARATAMGGAFAPVADEPAALFFNPAGLDQVPGGNVALTYYYPYTDVKDIAYADAAISYNMSGRGFALGTFGAGANYFRASAIPEATGLGLSGREFSDYEMALWLGWGKALGGNVVGGEEPRYYLGLAAKIISTKIYDYADGGFGLDVGAMFRPVPPMRVGVAFANVVAPNVELISIRDVYPATARVGAALDLAPGAIASAEGDFRKDGDAEGAVGGEAIVANVLAIRAGYRYPANAPTAGLGVLVKKYRFDVCWRPHAELGDSYVATAALSW
jgi:hypothetical protein